MSCIICMDDIENIILQDAIEEKSNLDNQIIQTANEKILINICKTCKCMACNQCMIQYVNEFENTQCPSCRLPIDTEPFIETNIPENREVRQSFLFVKIPGFVVMYIGMSYIIGQQILKSQFNIKHPNRPIFVFINIFVGMIVINFSYVLFYRCCLER